MPNIYEALRQGLAAALWDMRWEGPEEAVICINSLSEAWEETEGHVDWMFGEYFVWERARAKKLRDKKRKQRKNVTDRRKRHK